MDPLSAFGLVMNIAAIIDLSVKVIDSYKNGLGPDHARLKGSADEMDRLCQHLGNAKIMALSATGTVEGELQDCARRCMENAEAIRMELDQPALSRRQRAIRGFKLQFSRRVPRLERDY